MSAPVIETRGLGYVYNPGLPTEKVALRDVNLQIERGEFVGVIGQTGSGKSTLIQQLNGLLRPTSGQVLIDGEDIWQDKEQLRRFRFKVGLCFQYPEYQLFEESVYKDISLSLIHISPWATPSPRRRWRSPSWSRACRWKS